MPHVHAGHGFGQTGKRMDIDVKKIIEELDTDKTVVLESRSAADTAALGQRLGEICAPGQVYTLTGDLGVGKTVFTQGFARGLGHSTISMSTASRMWRRWRRSAMRTAFTGRESAS